MEGRKTFNSNELKVIAIIAMTIDHLTWAFFPGTEAVWYVVCLHIIGRLTAPIMWFFIAEGCYYTHNMGKYILRLFIFAVISHFAYCFAFGISFMPFSGGAFNKTSVMWSLMLSVVLIWIYQKEKIPEWVKFILLILICVISFPSDWSSIAVMCPFYLYMHRGDFELQARDIVLWTFIYAAVYFIFLDKLYGILQMFTFLTIPLLSRYNGKRGNWKEMKWLFYIYYPAHLLIIGLIRIALNGDISIIF